MVSTAPLFDWTPPRAAQVESVCAHAEENLPGWKMFALGMVRRYARDHQEFVSEDCTDWAYENGLVKPKDPRAMGQIYREAAKAGVIAKSPKGGWSKKRASPTTLWSSCICKVAA